MIKNENLEVNLEKILIEDIKKLFYFIKNNINNCSTMKNYELKNYYFHHNKEISNITEVLKYGILSINEECKKKGIKLTKFEKWVFEDEFHVNGTDFVSIAATDIDYDKMFPKRLSYNPYLIEKADILLCDSIRKIAMSNQKNYSNEFLVKNVIPVTYFKRIEFRFLSNINKVTNENQSIDKNQLVKLINYYNYLIDIANLINLYDLEIELIEASFDKLLLDKTTLSKLNKILVK